MFDNKTGRTKEGWPVEQIKAGGLFGLCWYLCYYAARKAYPAAVSAAESARLGLDERFVEVFLTMYPSFAKSAAVVDTLSSVLRAAEASGDRGIALGLAAALATAFDPEKRYLARLNAQEATELVGGAAVLLAHAQKIAQRCAGVADSGAPSPVHPLEQNALDLADYRLRTYARRCLDVRVSRGEAKGVPAFAIQSLAVAAMLEAEAKEQGLSAEELAKQERKYREAGVLVVPSAVPLQWDLGVGHCRLWQASMEALAAQWTYAEHALFRSIPMGEWLEFGWDNPRYQHQADACRRFVDRFNAFSLWVTAEVLAQPTSTERAAMVVRFVKLAVLLRRYNNFSALAEISTGLRRGCLLNLRSMWSQVPEEATRRLQEVHTLVSDEKNYRNYKSALRAIPAAAPVVPHLGAHTSELTAQEMVIPQETSAPNGDKLINFNRYRQLISSIAPLLAMQETPFEGRPDFPAFSPTVHNLLSSTVRPFVFFFEEDREKAVAQLAQHAADLEIDETQEYAASMAAQQQQLEQQQLQQQQQQLAMGDGSSLSTASAAGWA
jgi:hypothetical protein